MQSFNCVFVITWLQTCLPLSTCQCIVDVNLSVLVVTAHISTAIMTLILVRKADEERHHSYLEQVTHQAPFQYVPHTCFSIDQHVSATGPSAETAKQTRRKGRQIQEASSHRSSRYR